MKTAKEIKTLVKEKYSEIAEQDPALNAVSCCGVDGCTTLDYSIFSEDYRDLDGYLASADLQLGCGMPVEFARIAKGDTVVDLGSGAGNDVFVARAITGETGQVFGIDMTPVMIEKANANAKDLGVSNVHFRLGEIENIPMTADKADVVISNCVLNLVPDKDKAFAEIHRILKPGGHFCISDVVLKGELPPAIKEAGEMYAGCVSGALQRREFLGIIHDNNFQIVSIKAEKEIKIPDEILSKYMSAEELLAFRQSGTGIYSITVYAEKEPAACCDSNSGCC
ncbi:MAG TPA: arsenite methyltransferase [Bacteroidetes bacterium]|nr:arsenite methyltransferase [Bacteroidota bacterium]